MKLVQKLSLAVMMLLLAASLLAQGTTANLTGNVTQSGAGLPGVTVTISSPSLQGVRTAVTGDGGAYAFASIPPGDYTVTFDLEGMQRVTKKVMLSLAQTSRADATLSVSAISEAITVTASAPSVLETSQVTTNLPAEFIEELPIGRTITQRIQLAPGVNTGGPNGQTIIHGAQSFDNLYLVNGVVANENVRGQPHNVFIEDAIQETTLLTGGVSAEYGRFTGGVVSTITKSGGNVFSGSLRSNATNDAWAEKTIFRDPVTGVGQVEPIDNINEVYEATFGGRIIRDRLWFFTSGRYEDRATTRQTRRTNISYINGVEDRRYEGKLTGQITQRHSVVGSYLDSSTAETNNAFGNVVDLRSLANRELPLSLLAFHYNGVLTNNFLIEGQYSAKDFAFVGGGATSRDIVEGTLLRDIVTAERLWSPTFCGVCPDKERNNKDYLLKGSYFLTTRALGSHNIVAGYDQFHELRKEDNYQSGSDYRLFGNFITSGQNVFFHLEPSVPGDLNSFIEWDPILASSQTSDFATKSLFLNDKWELNNFWSFNLGVRYDKNDGKNQAGVTTTDDSAYSPRLGLTYDVRGNGRQRVTGTYSRYIAKIDQGPADATSTAGRPASYYYEYRGPEINGPGTTNFVPTAEVIRRAFEWFRANGGTNMAPFDQSVPGLSERFRETLASPYMDEITFGFGTQVGTSGFLRADVISREWSQFYGISRDRSTGQAKDPAGRSVDIGYIENQTDGLVREYRGVDLQGSYKLLRRFTLGGNYTWAELEGNVEGETSNNATVLVTNNNYPEYTRFARNQPVGYLSADIRHRANLWLQYDVPTPVGILNLSLLERFHSGQAYSAIGTIDVRQSATNLPTGIVNPGYATPPSSVTYYFSDRGDFRLDDITSTDLAINYSIPISKLNLFINADLINALGEEGLEDPTFIRTTVRTRRNGATFANPGGTAARAAAFNPFTDTPREFVAGVSNPTDGVYNFAKDVNFGKAITPAAYQTPRTYRFSVGLRF